ncbi:MAG: hypothetical protein ACLFVQ_08110 [Chitinispirillaceae bacterium]
MSRQITLIDTTLRDGAQRSHIVFSQDDKLRIAKMLDSCGVSVLEAGIPVMGKDEQNSILEIKHNFPLLHLVGWCRGKKSDVDAAIGSGCDSVHISFPSSALHQTLIGVTSRDVIDLLGQTVRYAQGHFASVSVGAQDASRADREFLKEFVAAAVDAGAGRIRIADTVGILTPLATALMIGNLLTGTPGVNLEFHAHNDLGMATANTITAIESGAASASVTLCGIGERAGNAPLEEVAVALDLDEKFSTGLATQYLKQMCEATYKIIRQNVPFQKPIVGKGVFSHESGIHCHGLLRDVRAYEPFHPESVGQQREFFAGSHSGTSGLLAMLARNGISRDRVDTSCLIEKVRQVSRMKSSSLSSEEIGLLIEKK